ncbi:triose-phosphate isomerase [Paenibacillus alba]|uniref:triose-phosphate isomerase n=1 Tax=Paenibacillus alba TaxID=1197127 RepID=UPI001564CF1B|nr:triose-phosphate isomerase [Paenibacillus alba]NQX69021.1 triose-phosphate isomerase [Paenibacillus alba]
MDSALEKHIRQVVQQVLSSIELTDITEQPSIGRSKPLIVANWKMNMTLQEAREFFSQLNDAPYEHCEAVCCPPSPLLYPLKELMQQAGISLGAQNIHEKPKGAHTGEVHGELLFELGCSHVIIGHSERRAAGETDEQVAAKVHQAIENSLIPIVCVGETQLQRELGLTKEVIRTQVESAFAKVTEGRSHVIIAYEPIWAIGTGKTAQPSDAQDIHREIRQMLAEKKGIDFANEVPILYGGSVSASNIKELCAREDIDGALVGGASLQANSFEAILKALR